MGVVKKWKAGGKHAVDKKGKNKTKKNVAVTKRGKDVLADLKAKKKDLELIQDIDDDCEALDCDEDFEDDSVKHEELEAYIDRLGFSKCMEDGTKYKKTNTNECKKHTVTKENTQHSPKKQIMVEKKGKKKNKYKDIQKSEVSNTNDADHMTFVEDFLPRKHLLLKPAPKWYSYEIASSDLKISELPPAGKMEKLLTYTVKLYENEVSIYKTQQQQSRHSEAVWLRTVFTSGTLKDKMAAWTLKIQEAPVHNMTSLEHLITMISKKGRREALMALDTLKELFISELLPDDRKLRTFEQHPLALVEKLSSGNKDSRDKRLILWYFEEKLKQKYAAFIQGLENLCHDNVRAAKMKGLRTVLTLLASKPEQEQKLLSILTNKLGDPDYKVASTAAYCLKSLVEQHPNMKQVVVADVERLIYRPNISQKAQYYAVCFLNQIILSKEEDELAQRLIKIYFSFFKAFVKKGEVDGKMLGALLTGVNRAYPFAKDNNLKLTEHIDTLYRVIHFVNFNTGVQALMLLYQVTNSRDNTGDRFYQALYRKMLDPGLVTSSKHALFLNLLYKSMKNDSSERRVKAFIKRILQVCSYMAPPFICGCLILLSELFKCKPALFQFAQKYQDSDDEDEHFVDAPDEDSKPPPDAEQSEDTKPNSPEKSSAVIPSWVHKKNIQGGSTSHTYDPYHRNPLYCKAESECIWELVKLTHHYHPTVALYTKNVLKGELISYQGDPLEDFTLIRFLDRFVYRNPKKKEKLQKSDNKIHSRLLSKLKYKVGSEARAIPVNSERFLEMGLSKIPIEDQFFYRYFSQYSKKKKRKHVEEDIVSDVDDDEFDRYLDDFEQGLVGKDLNLDFASEFSKAKLTKKSSKKKQQEEEEDEEEDEMEDFDLTDEEVEFEVDDDDDELMADLKDFSLDEEESSGSINEEDIAFSDNDEDMSSGSKYKKVSRRSYSEDDEDIFDDKRPMRKKRKPNKLDSDSLNTAAEEFAELIDENADSKLSMTGSNALSNRDNADVKQLKWEMDRARWISGTDWKTRKRQKRIPKRGREGVRSVDRTRGKSDKKTARFKGKMARKQRR